MRGSRRGSLLSDEEKLQLAEETRKQMAMVKERRESKRRESSVPDSFKAKSVVTEDDLKASMEKEAINAHIRKKSVAREALEQERRSSLVKRPPPGWSDDPALRSIVPLPSADPEDRAASSSGAAVEPQPAQPAQPAGKSDGKSGGKSDASPEGERGGQRRRRRSSISNWAAALVGGGRAEKDAAPTGGEHAVGTPAAADPLMAAADALNADALKAVEAIHGTAATHADGAAPRRRRRSSSIADSAVAKVNAMTAAASKGIGGLPGKRKGGKDMSAFQPMVV